MKNEFPIDFIFFGSVARRKLEGGTGITIQKNNDRKLTFLNDNPFGLTRSIAFTGEDINVPFGFQLVVHGEFIVEEGATLTIESGGALVVL